MSAHCEAFRTFLEVPGVGHLLETEREARRISGAIHFILSTFWFK